MSTHDVLGRLEAEGLQQCWICCKKIEDSVLLPYQDEYLGEDVSIFKNTFIIKDVGPFKFLYYVCCNQCVDNYLKHYGRTFKMLKNRELGKSF